MATNILHVDGDGEARLLVRRAAERVERNADVIAVDSVRSAMAVLTGTKVACVVVGSVLRDATAADAVHRLHGCSGGVPVIALTYGAGGRASGASGVALSHAADPQELSVVIRETLGRAILCEVAAGGAMADAPVVSRFGGNDFIASTAAMRQVLQLVECGADSSVPVLIEGETGTGKEILARALHARSARRNAPFLVQNCGAVAEAVLESELFGHVRGAFTGADRDRAGLFVEAGDGTVFLDEIGEASPAVQARLLRVVQHHEVKPVGSDRVQRVAARIVAATNRSLADDARAGRFRADLYYRLSVFPIGVPPLRHRAAEVPLLVRHFAERFQREERKAGFVFSREALRLLTDYPWPGNVRELQHEVHRLVITLPSNTRIGPEHLASRIAGHGQSASDEPLSALLARVELALIRQRLDRFPTKASAARSLGITREALYWKLRRLGATDRDDDSASDDVAASAHADEL